MRRDDQGDSEDRTQATDHPVWAEELRASEAGFRQSPPPTLYTATELAEGRALRAAMPGLRLLTDRQMAAVMRRIKQDQEGPDVA